MVWPRLPPAYCSPGLRAAGVCRAGRADQISEASGEGRPAPGAGAGMVREVGVGKSLGIRDTTRCSVGYADSSSVIGMHHQTNALGSLALTPAKLEVLRAPNLYKFLSSLQADTGFGQMGRAARPRETDLFRTFWGSIEEIGRIRT